MTNMTDKGLERKKEIYKAAFTIFMKSGFKDAKVEHIAREAGIGKGTIYHYFESKEAILSEMIGYYMSEYFMKIKAIFSASVPIHEKINRWLVFNLQCSKTHDSVVNLFRGNGISMPLDVKNLIVEGRRDVVDTIKNVLQSEIKEGNISPIRDADLAVSMMIGTVEQYFYCKEPRQDDVENVQDAELQSCDITSITPFEERRIKELSLDLYKMLEVL